MSSGYLYNIFYSQNSYKELISKLAPKIKRLVVKHNVDSLVFQGVSGMAVGFPLTLKLHLNPVVVRKTLTTTHAFDYIEKPWVDYAPHNSNFFVIDDLIESGKTIRRILKFLKAQKYNLQNCKGILLYNQGKFSDKPKDNEWITKNVKIPIFYLKKRIVV